MWFVGEFVFLFRWGKPSLVLEAVFVTKNAKVDIALFLGMGFPQWKYTFYGAVQVIGGSVATVYGLRFSFCGRCCLTVRWLCAYTIPRVYVFLGGWIFADVESAFVIY